MECRLCLRSAPAETSVSIHNHPHPLVQCILTSYQSQANKDDMLPDTICFLCKNNLELLSNFKNTCIKSEETQKQKLAEILNIKTEEIILDDLIWEDEIGINSTSNVRRPAVDDEINKLELNNPGKEFSEGVHSKQNAKKNSPILQGKPTRENPYKCEMCSKSFVVKLSLVDHINHHKGIKPYRCEVCSKSFTSWHGLKRHKKTHIEEKRFRCEMCSKSFTAKPSLVEHMNLHKGIKPFQCDICSVSYSHSSTLRQHKYSH
ncbi:uncharacterized protein LOC143915741 [Arctopsyche grandis]|uniref:uncharacterized protein LOC143915741 n=1 Tax=Arctopsyche grandis TaxID=121162 RepID=UPI00406D973C